MLTVNEVTEFIDGNILHSKLFDSATDKEKSKALNQSLNTLTKYLPDVYKDKDSVPVEDVAEQIMWLFKLDDSMQRAELGVASLSVDGIQIQMREMDRTIAPAILKAHGKTSVKRARVGSYDAPLRDTFRMGIK